jgi:hypothetical protein
MFQRLINSVKTGEESMGKTKPFGYFAIGWMMGAE